MNIIGGPYPANYLLPVLQKWLCHFAFTVAMYEISIRSTSSSTTDMVSLFNFNYFTEHVVELHCGFNLHFSEKYWLLASFPMSFVSHLNVLFCEVSVQAYCLFLLGCLSLFLTKWELRPVNTLFKPYETLSRKPVMSYRTSDLQNCELINGCFLL